jgi:hypothetical protein
MKLLGALLESQPFIALFLTIGLDYSAGNIRLADFFLGVGVILFCRPANRHCTEVPASECRPSSKARPFLAANDYARTDDRLNLFMLKAVPSGRGEGFY